MGHSAAGFYQSKRKTYNSKLLAITKNVRYFAWYRFLVFLFIFIPLFFWEETGWWSLLPALAFIVLFFLLIKKNIQFEKQKKKYRLLKKLAEDELLALDHQFSHFDGGKEFLDTSHFYSYDLDVFGKDSVFQFINRTATQSGKTKLAEWMKNPPLAKDEIIRRQQAVGELAIIPNWRLHFLANGHLFKETNELSNELKDWSHTQMELNRAKTLSWLIEVLPLFTVAGLSAGIAGISWLPFSACVLVQWILLFSSQKRISYYYRFFGRKTELLGKYNQLLEFIEERKFHASYLIDLQKKVCHPDKASHIFQKLKKRISQFEYRQNLIVALILNSIFLWDLRCIFKLWYWHRKNHEKIASWLDVIAETDALISLANFANNQPGFVFPDIHEGGFTLKAENLGHPLLPASKRVCNNLEVSGWSKVLIITGANMAGKSTFLRTAGVNLILGRLGAPVCATQMIFTPVNIYTNMRTTDSLLKDESYFFAELKRIKGVLDRLEKGERIFVILDEMLKGTNSVDKLNGSKELIRKLLHLKAIALIATHDLKLSEMEEEHPQQVFNKCFEIRIKNNELIFDYLLSDGVTQTMNATFLMKKMGII